MKRSMKSIARGVVAVAAVLGVGAPIAKAEGSGQARPPVKVVASKLEGPFGLGAGTNRLFVAQTDGKITRINPVTGRKTVVAKGLKSPAGVDRVGHVLAIVTGGADVPDASTKGDATLFVKAPGEARKRLADLERYERATTPTGRRSSAPTVSRSTRCRTRSPCSAGAVLGSCSSPTPAPTRSSPCRGPAR